MTEKKETKTAVAKAGPIKISPRKLNLVAAMIRGMKVERALVALTFSKRRVAAEVKKVLQAAVANAEHNFRLNADRLVVAEAWVGKSMFLKRFHARGRSHHGSIVKMFSNITVVVAERQAEEKPAKAKPETKKTGKKKD